MRSFIAKFLFIFTFILMLAQGGFASTLNINSINYDNSGSILSINSFDNEDFNFDVKPQLYIDSANKKAYIEYANGDIKYAK